MSRVVSGARGAKEKDGVLVAGGSRPLERTTLRYRVREPGGWAEGRAALPAALGGFMQKSRLNWEGRGEF